MKIKLVSDLHLEFGEFDLENNQDIDVLILGGDIMVGQDLHEFKENDAVLPISYSRRARADYCRNFLKDASAKFPHVIYIAGNHEFYHGRYPDALAWIREETNKFANVYFLEMENKDIDDVTFVGATLWTDMNKGDPLTLERCRLNMNDYHVVRDSTREYSKLNPVATLKRHSESIAFVKQSVEQDADRKYVVVTHHAPTTLSTKPQYEKDFHLNGAYRSDLSEFILDHPQIKLWTHGHTHNNFDYMMGSTRVVCNPRGYVGYDENPTFDPNLVIEL